MTDRLKVMIIAVSLASSLAACSNNLQAVSQSENSNSAAVAQQANANKEPITSNEPPTPAQAQKPDRPLFKRATIMLEGNKEKMPLKLYASSERSIIKFTTYVPLDMKSSSGGSHEGEAVTFSANFGRKEKTIAQLHVFIFREGVSEQTARQSIVNYAGVHGLQERRNDAQNRFKWSLAEHDYMEQTKSGEWLIGTIALGKHNNHFFYVIIQYPEDYEEGFVPRAYLILDEWRWGDTDTGL